MIVGRKFDRLRKVSFSGCKCYLHLNTDFQVTEMIVKKLHWDRNYGHESRHWHCMTTCVDPDPLMVIDYFDTDCYLWGGGIFQVSLKKVLRSSCITDILNTHVGASRVCTICEPMNHASHEKKKEFYEILNAWKNNVSCLVLRFCWWNICRVTQYWLAFTD